MLLLGLILAVLSNVGTRTIQVGPGEKYEKPCQAFKDAQDGDTIEIDATGKYNGDVCRISANNLTIRGIHGRARIDAAGQEAEGKAIWVVDGNDIVIENIEFSGCKVPDLNGAGIRQEGTNLTVRACCFHDNENGILSGRNPASEILVESTEFARNGHGDGYSHNIYIGNIRKFTARFCYSHEARGGHLVKSRAAENHILYNRLTDEGESSYKLDLPNGGLAHVIGNVFQQSPTTSNSTVLAFGEEGPLPASRLLVINNTFVNDRHSGVFIKVSPIVTRRSLIVNNIFAGTGQVCSQETARMFANFVGADPGFLDRARFDYRLRSDSPCIDAGADLAKLDMEEIIPRYEYAHLCGSKPRALAGPIDIGAFERAPTH
jgi:hypothetical protein